MRNFAVSVFVILIASFLLPACGGEEEQVSDDGEQQGLILYGSLKSDIRFYSVSNVIITNLADSPTVFNSTNGGIRYTGETNGQVSLITQSIQVLESNSNRIITILTDYLITRGLTVSLTDREASNFVSVSEEPMVLAVTGGDESITNYITNFSWAAPEISILSNAAYQMNLEVGKVISEWISNSFFGAEPLPVSQPSVDFSSFRDGDIIAIFGEGYALGHAGLWSAERFESLSGSTALSNVDCVLTAREKNGTAEVGWQELGTFFSASGRKVMVLRVKNASAEDSHLALETAKMFIGTPYPYPGETCLNPTFNKWITNQIYCSQVAWLGWWLKWKKNLDAYSNEMVLHYPRVVYVKRTSADVRIDYIENTTNFRKRIGTVDVWVPVSFLTAQYFDVVMPSDLTNSDQVEVVAEW